jgi:hypothetical protein
MKFKEIMSAFFRLPARVLGGIVGLLLGDYARKRDGSITDTKPFLGLLGVVLESAKFILDLGRATGRMITNLIKNHQQAIASAFWVSLLVGGAAALTVALWPAALAAVTSFSIAGYSIASVVGTGFAAQVGAIAGIGAVLSSAAVYSVAAVANFVSFVKGCFTKKAPPANEADFVPDNLKSSVEALGKLNTKGVKVEQEVEPIHTASLLKQPKVDVKQPTLVQEVVVEGQEKEMTFTAM